MKLVKRIRIMDGEIESIDLNRKAKSNRDNRELINEQDKANKICENYKQREIIYSPKQWKYWRKILTK